MMPSPHQNAVERPLSAIERRMFLLSRGGAGAIIHRVQVRGPLVEARLRPALDKLRLQHPLLWARVVCRQGRLWFTTDGAAPLSFRAMPGDGRADGWAAIAADEQAVPIDPTTGPLFRLVLLEQPGGAWADLIITGYHAATDALSFLVALGDLFTFVAFPDTPVEPVPPALPLAAMLPPLPSSAVLPTAPPDMRPLPPPLGPAPPSEISITTAQLPPARTRALARRCKQHGVTMHAVLCGAAAPAFAVHHAGKDVLTIGSPASFRRFLQPPSNRDHGNFIDFVGVPIDVSTPSSLWERARKISQQFSEKTNADRLLHRAAMLEAVDRDEPNDHAFLARTSALKGPPEDLSISNLGRRALPTHYGDLSIMASHHGSCLPGEAALGVSTLDDSMHLTLMSNGLDAEARSGTRRALAATLGHIVAHTNDA